MIGYLEGEVVGTEARGVVLKVGGVGYRLFATPETIEKARAAGGPVSFHTHMAVRENAQELYGFLSREERDFFELLVGNVSGVGPKSALAILSIASPDAIAGAIARNDLSYLTKVAGIGKKTAEKMLVELRGKAAPLEGGIGALPDSDVLEALKSLGYGERETREALKKIPSSLTSTTERVREALKLIGGN